MLEPMSNSVNPIPPGFHSITPHLSVIGAAAFIDFLKKAFNAVEIARSPGPGGKLMHASVRIGDSMLMFADDFAAEFNMPPLAKGRMPFVLHLYVPDADAAWAQALAGGLRGGISDPGPVLGRPLRAREGSVRVRVGHCEPERGTDPGTNAGEGGEGLRRRARIGDNRRMATCGFVEYADAGPEVRAVYDDIMATRKTDWINNFWKALAHDPATLRRTWESVKQVMAPGALDALTKEMLYVAISATNQCGYCIASHTAGARKAGMTDAMFAEVMAVVGMANETNRLASGYQVEIDERFRCG